MRVFLDTNIIVSAFAARGLCTDVFRHVLAEHELIVGEVVIQELRRTLRDRIRLPGTFIDEVEDLLRECEVVAKPRRHLSVGLRDRDDEWIVASAVEGRADVLVTGDRELLALELPVRLRVLSARQFWELVRSRRR